VSRRVSIESAAKREFAELGFHGARVERIATAAGVNKQLIYYYFGSKRGLYEHTLRQASESLRVAPAERRQMAGSPAERIRRLIEQSMERAVANPDVLRSALGATDRSENPGRQALTDLANEFAREISRGQGLGYFRDDADPAVLGHQTAALVLGWVAMTGTPAADSSRPDPAPWATAAADLIGRALAW
jgi:TetR/AcrR family transcriptional regulator